MPYYILSELSWGYRLMDCNDFKENMAEKITMV